MDIYLSRFLFLTRNDSLFRRKKKAAYDLAAVWVECRGFIRSSFSQCVPFERSHHPEPVAHHSVAAVCSQPISSFTPPLVCIYSFVSVCLPSVCFWVQFSQLLDRDWPSQLSDEGLRLKCNCGENIVPFLVWDTGRPLGGWITWINPRNSGGKKWRKCRWRLSSTVWRESGRTIVQTRVKILAGKVLHSFGVGHLPAVAPGDKVAQTTEAGRERTNKWANN